MNAMRAPTNDEVRMTNLEEMTNGEMTSGSVAACSSFGFRVSFVICWSVILMLVVQTCFAAMAQGQSPDIIGRWNVEIAFGNGDHRSLRFDAQGEGKGTFLVLDPTLKAWGPSAPSPAKWAQGEGNSVTFSGPVEFPIGNVGRDAGTLVCKGKFDTAKLITGEVEFSPLVGKQPSKHGTFKAVKE
jgi:hypothetical protein